MEDVKELIKRYGLEENAEHVIIPYKDRDGKLKRCFLLKRRYMRIMYPEGHYVDYPLAEVIEATVRYPDLLLSEALYLLHREKDQQVCEGSAIRREESTGNYEEKDTH